jgi:hypothetical protein
MARSTATITSELQNDSQSVFHLMELHFDDALWDDIFLTDNFHDVELDTPTQASAQTYTAAGGFLNFAAITETTQLAVNTITISLSGIDNQSIDNQSTGIIAKLMQSPIINKRVVIYRSFGVPTVDPFSKTYMIFDGNVKNWSVDETVNEATISVEVSTHWANFEQKSVDETVNEATISVEVSTHWANFEQKNGRITNTTTQSNTTRYGSTQKFSSDRGLEYASSQIADIQWGPSN